MFAIRQVCEKYLANEKDVFLAFMDLEKLYDISAWHVAVLIMYGVGGKLLKAVLYKVFMYIDNKACVWVGKDVSKWFLVNVGLRQGCVMSPWLFNMHKDGVVQHMIASMLGKGLQSVNGGKFKMNQLSFPDDTALVADSEEKLLLLSIGLSGQAGLLPLTITQATYSSTWYCKLETMYDTAKSRANAFLLALSALSFCLLLFSFFFLSWVGCMWSGFLD